ncbi:hypothetical protein [Streptomyces hydrogenans]|uniref:DUF3558 domain-containing protein n=1 Tax=Streptomyces hydrogenans TaxID=1873719 RepID=A0ABQ3P479_9ACTN|nr:hypothetical protein [Streptomyces hydrogenans]GHG36322.1 hypothetical protein GCM10018784_57410 [Streptomyces hydrogenans]GHI19820.1 hypothetical protein Shyd_11910 [Streptomyces hydrogenans]
MKYTKAVAALALVLLASGCSQPAEEKRAFQVPSALCGTPVPVELLSPALPASGERIEEERKDGDGYFTCKVAVDGKSALTARWEWMKAGKTARSVAYDNPYRDLADVESEDKRYVYSGVGGVSRVTCEPVVAHRKGQAELFATIALSDREAPAPEMKKLLLAYAEALSDSSECVQK